MAVNTTETGKAPTAKTDVDAAKEKEIVALHEIGTQNYKIAKTVFGFDSEEVVKKTLEVVEAYFPEPTDEDE